MTAEEFARKAVGLPWRRWRADWSAMDCFGCVVLFHREVLGIELGEVPQTDIATGFAAARGWVQCAPEAGATAFMAWERGAPTHCGIVLAGGLLLHSQAGRPVPDMGSVRITRLAALERVASDITFYRRAA